MLAHQRRYDHFILDVNDPNDNLRKRKKNRNSSLKNLNSSTCKFALLMTVKNKMLSML